MSVHYKFGGSTANRSLNCGAWQTLSENIPSGPPSKPALEGTMMHMMFEQGMLDEEYDPADYIGQSKLIEGTKLKVTDKHVDKVYTAYDVQAQLEEDWDLDKVFFEVLMKYSDDVGGTADIIGWSKRNNLFAVGDLKTGDGLMVYADYNKQLLFYAWLAVNKYLNDFMFNDDTIIRLYIIQPSDRRDDPLDYWDVNLKQIGEFASAFKLAIKESNSGLAEPSAGDWCAYCPSMAVCPAKTGLVAASQRMDIDKRGDLLKGLEIVDQMEKWCAAVRKLAHEQLDQGVELTGWKLVPKRATRVWTQADDVEQLCKKSRKLKAEDYYNMKLMSPAQLEKSAKQKKFDFKKLQEYISLHSSGTTLVKESDPRQAALPLKALAAMAASIKK